MYFIPMICASASRSGGGLVPVQVNGFFFDSLQSQSPESISHGSPLLLTLTAHFPLPVQKTETWLIEYHNGQYCNHCRGTFVRTGDLVRVWRHHDNFLYCCAIEARLGLVRRAKTLQD